MPETDLTPTSAKAWQREEPEPHRLPSGNVAVLVRPQIFTMLRHGQIPNPLMSAALDVIEGNAAANIDETLDLCLILVSAAFADPAVTLEGATNGALSIDDVSDADKRYVLDWAMRGVVAATPFRDDRPGDEPGRDGGDVQDDAVGAPSDS